MSGSLPPTPSMQRILHPVTDEDRRRWAQSQWEWDRDHARCMSPDWAPMTQAAECQAFLKEEQRRLHEDQKRFAAEVRALDEEKARQEQRRREHQRALERTQAEGHLQEIRLQEHVETNRRRYSPLLPRLPLPPWAFALVCRGGVPARAHSCGGIPA